jgi:hypothetical protein
VHRYNAIAIIGIHHDSHAIAAAADFYHSFEGLDTPRWITDTGSFLDDLGSNLFQFLACRSGRKQISRSLGGGTAQMSLVDVLPSLLFIAVLNARRLSVRNALPA